MPPEFTKNFADMPPKPQAERKPSSRRAKGRNRVDIRYTLALMVFFCTLIASGAVVGAKAYLGSQIQKTEERIAAQEEAIQQRTIRDLLLFSEQIHTFRALEASRRG